MSPGINSWFLDECVFICRHFFFDVGQEMRRESLFTLSTSIITLHFYNTFHLVNASFQRPITQKETNLKHLQDSHTDIVVLYSTTAHIRRKAWSILHLFLMTLQWNPPSRLTHLMDSIQEAAHSSESQSNPLTDIQLWQTGRSTALQSTLQP